MKEETKKPPNIITALVVVVTALVVAYSAYVAQSTGLHVESNDRGFSLDFKSSKK